MPLVYNAILQYLSFLPCSLLPVVICCLLPSSSAKAHVNQDHTFIYYYMCICQGDWKPYCLKRIGLCVPVIPAVLLCASNPSSQPANLVLSFMSSIFTLSRCTAARTVARAISSRVHQFMCNLYIHAAQLTHQPHSQLNTFACCCRAPTTLRQKTQARFTVLATA